jgi:leucyl/phenylalanyl-tRNA--protein transferase
VLSAAGEGGSGESGYALRVTRPRLPVVLASRGPPRFPDPRFADRHGLVAAGGSLGPEWLLAAYELGIFPWYDAGVPPLWWSPDPRAILDPEALHISRSMRRFIRTTTLRVSFNEAFAEVMRAAAEDREEGTWILPEMMEAYCRLHELGHAHSIEVWNADRLVGGLYGVQRGALFAAESMFHRESNASKLALICAIQFLFRAGIRLFDVQFLTPHLVSLGAYTVPREEYLARLPTVTAESVDLTNSKLTLTADTTPELDG